MEGWRQGGRQVATPDGLPATLSNPAGRTSRIIIPSEPFNRLAKNPPEVTKGKVMLGGSRVHPKKESKRVWCCSSSIREVGGC